VFGLISKLQRIIQEEKKFKNSVLCGPASVNETSLSTKH
jgi:hypothetical protein